MNVHFYLSDANIVTVQKTVGGLEWINRREHLLDQKCLVLSLSFLNTEGIQDIWGSNV